MRFATCQICMLQLRVHRHVTDGPLPAPSWHGRNSVAHNSVELHWHTTSDIDMPRGSSHAIDKLVAVRIQG
eukprot:CAMPEP_0115833890 /NCGR_PEP_ID=MMETSP0287-20121206/3403_1 /TAXON_ID=412157 /ORGANISM="Chrysochromulina rotalis, Strain UIO044" /LENGTH=70 /DNA_ID=CAMNT_0003287313 /DNA_START=919 /DNA_END=1127 /DNA_ORIENTATION=+